MVAQQLSILLMKGSFSKIDTYKILCYARDYVLCICGCISVFSVGGVVTTLLTSVCLMYYYKMFARCISYW